MTKASYFHSLALTEEDERQIAEIQKRAGITIVGIFRAGLKSTLRKTKKIEAPA
jgi:hypothetical protein